MEPSALVDALTELAEAAGLRVRVLPASAAREGERLPESGRCRIGGQWWLVLSAGETVDARIRSAALALREHAGDEWLDDRYVAPAVRAALEASRGDA